MKDFIMICGLSFVIGFITWCAFLVNGFIMEFVFSKINDTEMQVDELMSVSLWVFGVVTYISFPFISGYFEHSAFIMGWVLETALIGAILKMKYGGVKNDN